MSPYDPSLSDEAELAEMLTQDTVYPDDEAPPDDMIREVPVFPDDPQDTPTVAAPPEAPDDAKVIPIHGGEHKLSIQEQPKQLSDYVISLGEAMSDRKPPEWLVEGILPKGAFVMLAGEPKRARKTLLTLHLALCLARGEPFLGFTTKKSRVVIANMEDGYQCLLERFWAYGVREGSDLDISLLRDDGDIMGMLSAGASDPPDALIIDPMMELELEYGVKSENDATDIGRVLRDMRNLARRQNILVFLAHHSGTRSEIRGSSSFRGSTDGWLTLAKRPKSEVRRLAWWLRRAPEGYVDVDINVTAGDSWQIENITVDCAAPPVLGAPPEGKGGKKDDDESGDDEAIETFNAETYSRICEVLQEAGEPVNKTYIRKHAKVRADDVPRALEMLERDGLIEITGTGKRQRYEWIRVGGETTSPGDGTKGDDGCQMSQCVSVDTQEGVSEPVKEVPQCDPLDLF